jgi:pimeloyl-ACP methyl ester carboxylesterase
MNRRYTFVSTAARELLSLAGAAATLPRALATRGPRVTRLPGAGPARVGTPVLLLHGYLGTSDAWTPLTRRLRDEGFANVFTMGYDSLSAGVPDLAAALAEAVADVRAATGHHHVHLVGHSLGGLVVRYAVQRLGLDRVTRSVVTIGTPHLGARLARFGPGPAAAQLRPGSPFLRHLPPLEETRHVRWAVLYAGADLIVRAPRGHGRSFAGYGHHSVLSAPELADAVVEHVLGTEPPASRHLTSVPTAPGTTTAEPPAAGPGTLPLAA